VIGLALVAWIAAAPAAGVDVGPVGRALLAHMAQGLSDARTGEWVTYRLDPGDGRVTFWRLAVVGEEKDRLGRDAYWLEMEWGTHAALAAPLAQLRLLVAKEAGLSRGGITRMFWAQGADRAAEVDEASLAATARPAAPRERGTDDASALVRTGEQSMLMTAAGSVAAVPVEAFYRQTAVKRLWISRQVPVLHLAKLELPAVHHTLELQGYGVQAKPRMILPDPKETKIHLEAGGAP